MVKIFSLFLILILSFNSCKKRPSSNISETNSPANQDQRVVRTKCPAHTNDATQPQRDLVKPGVPENQIAARYTPLDDDKIISILADAMIDASLIKVGKPFFENFNEINQLLNTKVSHLIEENKALMANLPKDSETDNDKATVNRINENNVTIGKALSEYFGTEPGFVTFKPFALKQSFKIPIFWVRNKSNAQDLVRFDGDSVQVVRRQSLAVLDIAKTYTLNSGSDLPLERLAQSNEVYCLSNFAANDLGLVRVETYILSKQNTNSYLPGIQVVRMKNLENFKNDSSANYEFILDAPYPFKYFEPDASKEEVRNEAISLLSVMVLPMFYPMTF